MPTKAISENAVAQNQPLSVSGCCNVFGWSAIVRLFEFFSARLVKKSNWAIVPA
jgi:hypothetical protein